MIRQLLLLLLLFFHVDGRVVGWEPCGVPPGSYCQTPILHQIQCLEITCFPSFEDFLKPGVLMFTFFESHITKIQPFDEAQWPSLKRLNVIDTDNLTCEAIAAIQRPGLRIYSHCIDCLARTAEAPKASVVNHTLLITLYCLAVFYMFVVGCGIYYCQKRS